MTRQTLEAHQVLLYLAATAVGLVAGWVGGDRLAALELALWPLLAALLYATFTQVPLRRLRQAFADRRFVTAALVGNFVAVPALLALARPLLPADPAVRLGVVLVLLVPCTDWFVTFAHLGRGDTARAVAWAPVSLLLQLALLPVYLGLLLGPEAVVRAAGWGPVGAFVGLIGLPLLAAYATQRWAERAPGRARLRDGLAWVPVPALACVMAVIAATQVRLVVASADVLLGLLAFYVGYLVAAALLARLLAVAFRLPPVQGRTLAFSLGTRNSFVVLPLALALPPSFELAAVAIVFQSLVELVGMAVYVGWVPARLFPAAAHRVG